MMVGYVEKRTNLCFGFPRYIGHAFTDPALSGLQANMRQGSISQILLMVQIGLTITIYLNRINCMCGLTVVLLFSDWTVTTSFTRIIYSMEAMSNVKGLITFVGGDVFLVRCELTFSDFPCLRLLDCNMATVKRNWPSGATSG
jgi:hypothetical protein